MRLVLLQEDINNILKVYRGFGINGVERKKRLMPVVAIRNYGIIDLF